MKRKTLELLACPTCRGKLALWEAGDNETIETGSLLCTKCQRQYPIQEGIVHFIKREELTGLNYRFARFYDRFTRVYFLFNKLAFLFLGGVRKSRQEEIIDRLELTGGRVLEVSIGPGINLHRSIWCRQPCRKSRRNRSGRGRAGWWSSGKRRDKRRAICLRLLIKP